MGQQVYSQEALAAITTMTIMGVMAAMLATILSMEVHFFISKIT
jgi:hypothetical protein